MDKCIICGRPISKDEVCCGVKKEVIDFLKRVRDRRFEELNSQIEHLTKSGYIKHRSEEVVIRSVYEDGYKAILEDLVMAEDIIGSDRIKPVTSMALDMMYNSVVLVWGEFTKYREAHKEAEARKSKK